MRIKVLMVGDDPAALTADIQLLRDKQFLVYTSFYTDNLYALIEEVCPDVVLINPQNENAALTDVYNNLVNNIHIHTPVIYALSEDDIYLVTRKKSPSKEQKKVIADNITAAIKLALQYTSGGHVKTNYKTLHFIAPSYIHRA